MSEDTPKNKKTPAGVSDVQLSKLVTEKELKSLDKRPQVVAWTLSDFKKEAPQKTKNDSKEAQQQVKLEVEKQLQHERELLKKEKFELAYQQGYEKGFALGKEEGLEVGKSEAYNEARELIFSKLQNLDSMLTELQSPYEQLESHLLSELTQFAVHLAEKVILSKIEETPEWVLETVEKTVKGLPDTGEKVPVEVFVNSEDLTFLQSLPEFSQEPYCEWQLKADQSLPAGSCRVKQGFSSIHNDWQARFEQIKQQVLAQNSQSAEAVSSERDEPDDRQLADKATAEDPETAGNESHSSEKD